VTGFQSLVLGDNGGAVQAPHGIRLVDIGVALWIVVWLVAGVVVYHSIHKLEEGGQAVVSAGDGLDQTSAALDRAAKGLHQTADTLGTLDALPFVSGDPGAAVEQTANDVEVLADRVRMTAGDARTTGADAQDSASTLAVVLGLAVAFGTTLPLVAFYVLLRPEVATRVEAR
jgi:hypothetical protein